MVSHNISIECSRVSKGWRVVHRRGATACWLHHIHVNQGTAAHGANLALLCCYTIVRWLALPALPVAKWPTYAPHLHSGFKVAAMKACHRLSHRCALKAVYAKCRRLTGKPEALPTPSSAAMSAVRFCTRCPSGRHSRVLIARRFRSTRRCIMCCSAAARSSCCA